MNLKLDDARGTLPRVSYIIIDESSNCDCRDHYRSSLEKEVIDLKDGGVYLKATERRG